LTTAAVVRGAGLGVSAVPTRTGLSIAVGIGFNEWREIGDHLERMHGSSQWWIGDWLCYGERYRRDYGAAMQALELKFGALRGYALVASKVASATRVADLSWTHHRAVAALEEDDQRRWLDEALRQGWSTRELEDAIARAADRRTASPSFTVRAQAELYDLCTRAAARIGVAPADWAADVLERAAREQLGETEAAA
jgi:hypothetical protein